MRKGFGIAVLLMVTGLPMQMLNCVEVQAQAETETNPKAEADRLLEQGNQLNRVSKFREALPIFERSLQIYREIKNRKGESNALNNIGNAYSSLGKYQKSIEYHQQSLAIAQEIGDRNNQGNSLANLGVAYYLLGQYTKAIEYHEQALAIKKQTGDRYGEGRSLGNLGNAYNLLGQYPKAIDYYQKCLPILKQIGDRDGESDLYIALGIAYDGLGKYQTAIEQYQKALVIKKQINDRNGEADALNTLGGAYDSLGQYQKAIDYYQQSLTIKKQVGARSGEADTLNNLGIVHNSLRQYPKAIGYFQQALVIAREVGNRYTEGRTLNNLGISYRALGDSQRAVAYYQQSLEIAKQIGDRDGIRTALSSLGTAYNALGQVDQAFDYHQQALATAIQMGNRAGEGSALSQLGYLFSQQGQPELAILFYKRSINVREAIRKDIRGLSKEDQKSYLSTIESSYRRLADLLLKQGRVMEALQVIDLLKVQELEDYLKNIKGTDRTLRGIQLLDVEQAFIRDVSTVKFAQIAELNRQLASQIQQIPQAEINKVPDYLKQIPQRTVLFYPLILDDRLELILFSQNQPPISRTVNIKQDDLKTLIENFKSSLLDTGSEDFKEPAIQLYQLLIKPIETELKQANTETILYAPDGLLRYIPLSALYEAKPSDGKHWLIEKYRISNLIAYSLSDFTSKAKMQPSILAGAFGGKGNEKKFGQAGLPATIQEVQAIANSFQNSITLKEEQFSRKEFESRLKNHNILHLATHAEFNTGTPDTSFIIFGNGDKIRLNEISDWDIPNVDLIILSACQTGIGALGEGVEILGFGYQVQKAGAKSAIASLWKVDDTGTQLLMDAFYKELQKGNIPIAEALRRSQISLIKSSNYNHPYFWSAFFAIGNGL
ncbi:CHAT domain-containing protein [Pseudanabaena sp. Chao 1811]|uniref:CHAT domain-containing protein n=1 Tax=Pseudanabaena sp. Chao 1811 TaxID=2963092 RepID=UPI0022F39F40|nr:tetratricopeptide repeat protein [Pseudanabaena sp. Chao 1811]